MNYFSKIRTYIPVLCASFVVLGAVVAGLIIHAPSASALTKAAALDRCNTKVSKAACVARVNSCAAGDTVCYDKKSAVGDQVFSGCRDEPNPQACQKTVTDACKQPFSAGCLSAKQAVSGNAAATIGGNAGGTVGGNGGGAAGGAVQKADTITLAAKSDTADTCGSGDNAVKTSIDFGCTGQGNPIVDLAYAFIRFLSYGVGLVVVGSIIYAGIQYSSSSGNPEQTSAAKKRILNAFIALIFYLLIFAFIQYLVPGGLFN